jgi:general secretion pathway protein G
MNSRPSSRRARSAFTLIEIIVVILIIGVLAAVIAPRLLNRVGQAKSTAAAANAASLANQVRLMSADCGGALPPDTSIRALWECPSGIDKTAWKGPYVDNADALNDPWGNPFILVIPGKKNIDFDVVSYGSDGQPGGTGEAADVTKP